MDFLAPETSLESGDDYAPGENSIEGTVSVHWNGATYEISVSKARVFEAAQQKILSNGELLVKAKDEIQYCGQQLRKFGGRDKDRYVTRIKNMNAAIEGIEKQNATLGAQVENLLR
jgi:hypothetical protein